MEAKRVIFSLFLTVTILSYRVSGRLLKEDADLGTRSPRQSVDFKFVIHQHVAQRTPPASHSTDFNDLEEIDRLKLSINKLICDTMEEGCDHMDDAADHSDTADHTNESFATLNPHDYVREY